MDATLDGSDVSDSTDELAVVIGFLSTSEQRRLSLTDVTQGRSTLRTFIRAILERLVHARGCSLKKVAIPGWICEREDCPAFCALLTHLKQDNCTATSSHCAFHIPGCTCFSASATLAHFLRCSDPACDICAGFSKEEDNELAKKVRWTTVNN